jgi:thiol:disulfide interchange protein DsbA
VDRRDFLAGTAAVGLAGLSTGTLAQAAFTEGRHFVVLAQRAPVSAPAGKVEVVEFFSYACPHCYAFEPALDAWARKQPADVAFRRVPVSFLMNAENFQRLYFALEALGKVEALQRRVFEAFHVQKNRLSSVDAIADLVAANGVDRAKFLETFNSFGVQTKQRQAKQLQEAYKVDGVPALGVQGRFYTSPSLAGGEGMPVEASHQRALALTDQLIARVRSGR